MKNEANHIYWTFHDIFSHLNWGGSMNSTNFNAIIGLLLSLIVIAIALGLMFLFSLTFFKILKTLLLGEKISLVPYSKVTEKMYEESFLLAHKGAWSFGCCSNLDVSNHLPIQKGSCLVLIISSLTIIHDDFLTWNKHGRWNIWRTPKGESFWFTLDIEPWFL